MRLLPILALPLLLFIAPCSSAADPSIDFKAATRCLAIGDVAEALFVDLRNPTQQSDQGLIVRWTEQFNRLNLPVKYLSFAVLHYSNTRPTSSTKFAADTVAYCLSEEMPSLTTNPSCYTYSKALNVFFRARRDGKSKDSILAALSTPDARASGDDTSRHRMMQVVHFAFDVPPELEQSPYGRPAYFATCLLTSGDIYKRRPTPDR